MATINQHNYEGFLLDYAEGSLDSPAIAELKAFAMANPHLGIELDDLELPHLAADSISFDFKNTLKKSADAPEDEALLNYFENTVSPAEKAQFEAKLLVDTSLQAALDAYAKTRLSADLSVLINKTPLYKSEDELVLSNRAIAFMEGQLNAGDRRAFEKELQSSPQLAAELEAYKRTTLLADAQLIYPNKEELKKEGRVVALFGRWQAAAIAASVLLLAGLFVVNFNSGNPTGSGKLAGTKPAVKTVPGETVTGQTQTAQPTRQQPQQAVPQAAQQSQVATHSPVSKEHFNRQPASRQEAYTTNRAEQATKNVLAPQSATASKNSDPVTPGVTKSEGLANNTKAAAQETAATVPSTERVLALANNNAGGNSSADEYKPVYQLAVDNGVDEEEEPTAVKKNGFWRRAVKAAQKANVMGIKSIDGEEDNNAFHLSINAFSVEKK